MPVTFRPCSSARLLLSLLSATAPVATSGFQLSTYTYTSLVPAASQPGQIEYSNPQVLRQYDSRAVRVSIAAGGNADVTVDLIQVGE